MLAELHNIQQTDKTDIHEHCIRHDIQYLISPWWLEWPDPGIKIA